ncbi:MAG: microcystin degradation protein MlrC [Gammaproteobacteria bacterium]|jgi:microcystin degradation protein MlrC
MRVPSNFKVLSVEISHETNTFSIRPTTVQSFRDGFLLKGDEAISTRGDKNTELAGLLDVGKSYDWDITHVLSATAGPGGCVTTDAFDTLVTPFIEAADAPWDGIFLMLHGAMVPDFCEDGEGEILRRLRAVVGPDVPIAVTLDPHANVTTAMCELAQILVSFTTYPHVDMRSTAWRAAELLQQTMLGDIKPRTLRAHRPMLEEVNGGRTDIGPMIDRHVLARAYEVRKQVFAISVNGGFAQADIKEVGPTVLITCEGDPTPHQAIVEEIADDIWARRSESLNTYLTTAQAAEIAAEFKPQSGPLIIADYADNPGAGAYGDATNLLAALLDAGVSNACFGPIVDPVAAESLQEVALGTEISLAIGGRMAPNLGGGPLQVTGTVEWQGEGLVVGTGPMLKGLTRNFGLTAVLRVKGIDILVVSIATQILDLSQFETFGILPGNKTVVALKSMQHFRAAFAPIAERIVVCDSGALCTLDYKSLDYRRVPKQTFPL